MPFYGKNDLVLATINGQETPGKLVDINIPEKQFKVETEQGSFWVDASKIRPIT